MHCTNFEYAGEKLSDYGMIICMFNGDGGIETLSSGADITLHQAKPSTGNRFHIYASEYESPFTATFQIGKDPCIAHSQDNISLTTFEISAIQRWLCQKNQYNRFKIYQDGYRDIYWNATFSTKQVCLGGQVVGLELTLYTDAPYAYMDDVNINISCDKDGVFDIYDPSDEIGHIYPNMEITLLEQGDFMLWNTLDEGKATSILGCLEGETIKIDGLNQIISTDSNTHLLPSNFNYIFPKIINTYETNKNTFRSNLSCNIKLSYSPIRKVGL